MEDNTQGTNHARNFHIHSVAVNEFRPPVTPKEVLEGSERMGI